MECDVTVNDKVPYHSTETMFSHMLLRVRQSNENLALKTNTYVTGDNAMEDVVQAVLIGGVENWIRLPTGCVEQTIIRLAPLVYAFKYLKLTKQVTEKIEKDGNSYIRKGRW